MSDSLTALNKTIFNKIKHKTNRTINKNLHAKFLDILNKN